MSNFHFVLKVVTAGINLIIQNANQVDIQISSAASGSLTVYVLNMVLHSLLALRLKHTCIALMRATVKKFVDTSCLPVYTN
jgi:hypothetical protein